MSNSNPEAFIMGLQERLGEFITEVPRLVSRSDLYEAVMMVYEAHNPPRDAAEKFFKYGIEVIDMDSDGEYISSTKIPEIIERGIANIRLLYD